MTGIPIVSSVLGSLGWKAATVAAGVVSLGLGVGLVKVDLEKHELNLQNQQLTARINDPHTGYVAELAQSETNVATLKVSLARQNEAYQALSKDDAAKLAETTAALTKAEASTKAMQQKLNTFLATAPKGDTLDARVRDIDARALQELVQ